MLVILATTMLIAAPSSNLPTLLFVTEAGDNDIFVAAGRDASVAIKRFNTVAHALQTAMSGDGLLVMADYMKPADPGVPEASANATVVIQPAEWITIHELKLKVYVEFPRFAPPADVSLRATAAADGLDPPLQLAQTLWERVVVSAKGGMGTGLSHLALLHPHKKVDYVKLPQSWMPDTLLVIAKVAGYDNASFGLPAPNAMFPLLANPTPYLMVAATQLSHCRLRRFAPAKRWMGVVAHILDFVSAGAWKPPAPGVAGLWVPSVTASYSRDEQLPQNAEREALIRGVQFYRNARLMPDYERAVGLTTLKGDKEKSATFARLSPPYQQPNSGDGQLGVFEGLTSDISVTGKQPQSNGMRCDCVTETSAAFAARAVVTGNASDTAVAQNLLNYGHQHAGYSQPWAIGAQTASDRPWVVSGDAFGVMSWTTSDAAYKLMYKDDDARGLLGAVATAALLKSERWHSTITTATLGNLRITGENGFGFPSGGLGSLVGEDLSPTEGWRKIYDAPAPPEYSPHYVSYIWAVFLWGYRVSGFEPLLERAQNALGIMMEAYPSKWIPTSNGIAMQRARIILPLAFLVRANDTALHRQWLQTAIDGLMTRQYCEGSWCAFKEELSHPGWAKGTRVPDNENYGTFEAPLNQENDDPVSDFLYTSNFALLGLHEAAAALGGDPKVKDAEDKLADYIVRLQARSTEHPDLDGAFFRAFDYVKWEAWASDADIGWGAWSVESGWTQSWITITLGMRQLNTTLCDTWSGLMVPPPPPPPSPKPCSPPMPCLEAGSNATLYYTLVNHLEPLCAPQGNAKNVTTIFHGIRCGGNGSKAIQWQGMHTVDPRPGKLPTDCTWTESPGSEYVGGCGSCATAVRLPTHVC